MSYTDDVVSFSSDLTLNQDSSLSIHETIAYETTLTKHGIYRYIPYRYEINGKNITTKITNVTITDQNNRTIPFSSSYQSNSLMLKIGDKDVTFSGAKTYQLSYIVHNSLLLDQPNPRLVWDIVGEGWQIPVHTTHAVFHSPFASVTAADCKSGVFGSDDGKCSVVQGDEHTVSLDYNQLVSQGDNVTMEMTLSPQNTLVLPSATQQQLTLIADNLWILLFILPPIVCLYLWNRFGRDYEYIRYNLFDDSDRPFHKKGLFTRDAIPMVYEPLKISPGMAGAMLDESYDGVDLTADIIDLARQKYLTITQTQEKTWLKSADYEFRRLDKPTDTLAAHQSVLLTELFATGDIVKLSSLKTKFSKSFEKVKTSVFDTLTTEKYFTHNPNTVRAYTGGGATVLFIAVYLLLKIGDRLPIIADSSLLVIIPLTVVSGGICLFCIKNMTQKSAKGRNAQLQAVGLKETIKRGAWREKIMEKHLFFEDMLPFAIALGVVDQLAKSMQGLDVKPPSYMNGVNNQVLYTGGFYNGFATDVTSSMTVSPHSSSGGGGFSGGGGGGGGGGSW